jgi:hypothetical protein
VSVASPEAHLASILERMRELVETLKASQLKDVLISASASCATETQLRSAYNAIFTETRGKPMRRIPLDPKDELFSIYLLVLAALSAFAAVQE